MNKNYKTIAKGLMMEKNISIDLPTENLDARKISIDEIKEIVKEEFEKAKDVTKLKVKELPFSDAELEKEIDWAKTLKLENFFK